MTATEHVESGATIAHASFLAYLEAFREITSRSRRRFEARDWHGCESDLVERLEIYPEAIGRVIAVLGELLGAERRNEDIWTKVRDRFADLADQGPNPQIARTYFNSITRRIFETDGVNPRIEFSSIDSTLADRTLPPDLYRTYEIDEFLSRSTSDPPDDGSPTDAVCALVRRVLDDFRFDAPWVNADRDADRVAQRIQNHIEDLLPDTALTRIELLGSVFYRMKHAYVVGRLYCDEAVFPFILPLLHEEDGVFVDAVLLEEDEASILFSYTRAYFSVETADPDELVLFLQSILPRKTAAELYLSVGFYKHGKTEVYRRLARHLESSTDQFVVAEGERGMVMLVFVLPSFDLVFKLIRDRFAYPKTMTPAHVKQRYRMVFERDRVGRLVEAQSFQHLKFPKHRFAPELLEELRTETAQSVRIDEEFVSIDFLYTERKVRPLNLYLREVDDARAKRAVVDYGNAIKELAAANIFPGDFLLKNFGVTRHRRVVFYDYDELCLLTECNFRKIPEARTIEDELSAEPWYSVGPNDIFPEEFSKFLGIPPHLMGAFLDHHRDLLDTKFWRNLQVRHEAGEIPDVYPYPQRRRLGRGPRAKA
ncbi:MAG: bifunctional isocitrate dehydrogenase kinase/phosphatase [Candidatus Eisenbacteria bacterium]|uniref:Bifunctional isocitrate dehydrogenase kinase/phosphatase n=1 Tax=Eiseniibacteriota bacterium TaxID=2212470 RepID=A0A956SDL3_UNCEI|nr:bifunctional isocitrate dehydrogenase kinase/phosphatase [Candidatus Eisenbacteria bacterium]MCB9464548.1 bifunctional isocitrate dehydrogenase kinase/phosphatase [Candidatus Eisenbacteria bacterium]